MQLSTWLNRALSRRWMKPGVFLVALLPLVWLIVATALDHLGPNPAEALVRSTGDWTLRMLCVVLTITPARVALGLSALARFRRMVGLFVYFYAMLHLLAYSGFDMGFDVAAVVKDIAKRPFILVGFCAIVILSLLAVTSFKWAIQRMGGRRWQLLHRLVYFVATLAVLHFFWMRAGKNDFAEVAVYAAVIGFLLSWRIYRRLNKGTM